MTLRQRYMNLEITFDDYYGTLVELLGEAELRRFLPGQRTPEQWRDLVNADKFLNNVPLRNWDNLDHVVRFMVARCDRDKLRAITGRGGWSLSDSVCVLKTTARRVASESVQAPESVSAS